VEPAQVLCLVPPWLLAIYKTDLVKHRTIVGKGENGHVYFNTGAQTNELLVLQFKVGLLCVPRFLHCGSFSPKHHTISLTCEGNWCTDWEICKLFTQQTTVKPLPTGLPTGTSISMKDK